MRRFDGVCARARSAKHTSNKQARGVCVLLSTQLTIRVKTRCSHFTVTRAWRCCLKIAVLESTHLRVLCLSDTLHQPSRPLSAELRAS
jgi:hypothetical protein